jgi:hypothetical protein
MLTKTQKTILKKIYLKKFLYLTLAENEKYINIIKNHKIFNHYVGLFKKNALKLFKNNKNAFENICFMQKRFNML